jgi:hypothetical protein
MPATSAGMTTLRDDMSLLNRGLLIIAGLLGSVLALALIAFGIFFVNHKMESYHSEEFYASHPLLRSMLAANHNDLSAAMAAILLARIPIGSERSDAERILADEGMDCKPSDHVTPNSIGCFVQNRPSSVPRWYIEVKFDKDDKVSGGRVTPFKATS